MKRFLLVCLIFVSLSAIAATKYLTNTGTITSRSQHIGLTEVRKGVTAPTDTTIGTSPAVAGLLFDAVNEVYQVQFMIPDDWDGVHDAILDLYVALNAAETAGDTIAFTGDYVAASFGADAVSKTSTQLLVTETVLVGCAGVGCLYKIIFTFDHADSDNPLAVEDIVIIDIHRTNVTNVAGTVLVSLDVHTPRKL